MFSVLTLVKEGERESERDMGVYNNYWVNHLVIK